MKVQRSLRNGIEPHPCPRQVQKAEVPEMQSEPSLRPKGYDSHRLWALGSPSSNRNDLEQSQRIPATLPIWGPHNPKGDCSLRQAVCLNRLASHGKPEQYLLCPMERRPRGTEKDCSALLIFGRKQLKTHTKKERKQVGYSRSSLYVLAAVYVQHTFSDASASRLPLVFVRCLFSCPPEWKFV